MKEKVYIVELIKMSDTSLVKWLSDDTIWFLDLSLPSSRRIWRKL